MTETTDVRWVAWVTESALARLELRVDEWNARGTASNTARGYIMSNPPAYATKAHAVPEGVGGRGGLAGSAECGTWIPEDVDLDPAEWWTNQDSIGLQGIRKCKRCLRALKKRSP